MRGPEIAEIRKAVLAAFEPEELELLLRDHFDIRYRNVVPNVAFETGVQRVLEYVDRRGALARVVATMASERPGSVEIQRVHQKYARSLLDGGWRAPVDRAGAELLERFDLLPSFDVERAGAAEATTRLLDGFERVIRPRLPQLDPIAWATDLLRLVRRICLIEVRGAAVGTGFLVGPEAVLTNRHVVEDAIGGPGEHVTALFDYAKGRGVNGAGRRVACVGADWLADASPSAPAASEQAWKPEPSTEQLDYALLRLGARVGAEPIFEGGPIRGWIRLPATTPPVALGAPLAILQHPDAKPVKLTFDTEAILRVGKTRVRYATNTEPGSSGSPCFDHDWGLLFLHHYGDPRKRPEFNQGVPVAAIRERIARDATAAALLGGDPP
jgi:hypothetical protein